MHRLEGYRPDLFGHLDIFLRTTHSLLLVGNWNTNKGTCLDSTSKQLREVCKSFTDKLAPVKHFDGCWIDFPIASMWTWVSAIEPVSRWSILNDSRWGEHKQFIIQSGRLHVLQNCNFRHEYVLSLILYELTLQYIFEDQHTRIRVRKTSN